MTTFVADLQYVEVAHTEINERVAIDADTEAEAREKLREGKWDHIVEMDAGDGHTEYTGEIVNDITIKQIEQDDDVPYYT